MNVFEKLAEAERKLYVLLGVPLGELNVGRMTLMRALRGGKGFQTEAKEPRKDAQGLTRGDRKRALRMATNAKVSEVRAPEYQHRNSAYHKSKIERN